VWQGWEQSLIDNAVDQWPTRLRASSACVRASGLVDILNVPCDCQFVFSVLYELCFTPRLMQWVIF